MSTEEAAFFEASKKFAYRIWWLMNKTSASCPNPDCAGDGPLNAESWPDPDDGISFQHDPDCSLKDIMLAYWAMQDAKKAQEA